MGETQLGQFCPAKINEWLKEKTSLKHPQVNYNIHDPWSTHSTVLLVVFMHLRLDLYAFLVHISEACSCTPEKIYCSFICKLHSIPSPLLSVSLSSGTYCHSTSLPVGLYLPLFLTSSPHSLALPSFASLILFMGAAHSIILSPYISVCPSFSLHLSAPERDGGRCLRVGVGWRDGQIRWQW